MSAAARFLDTNGVTVITTDDEGNLATPSTSTPKKVWVENFGDQSLQTTILTITAVGTNDGSTYLKIAPDSGGSPGTFVTTPLSLGTIVAGAKVAVWFKIQLPSGLTPDMNQRHGSLVAAGVSV